MAETYTGRHPVQAVASHYPLEYEWDHAQARSSMYLMALACAWSVRVGTATSVPDDVSQAYAPLASLVSLGGLGVFPSCITLGSGVPRPPQGAGVCCSGVCSNSTPVFADCASLTDSVATKQGYCFGGIHAAVKQDLQCVSIDGCCGGADGLGCCFLASILLGLEAWVSCPTYHGLTC